MPPTLVFDPIDAAQNKPCTLTHPLSARGHRRHDEQAAVIRRLQLEVGLLQESGNRSAELTDAEAVTWHAYVHALPSPQSYFVGCNIYSCPFMSSLALVVHSQVQPTASAAAAGAIGAAAAKRPLQRHAAGVLVGVLKRNNSCGSMTVRVASGRASQCVPEEQLGTVATSGSAILAHAVPAAGLAFRGLEHPSRLLQPCREPTLRGKRARKQQPRQ